MHKESRKLVNRSQLLVFEDIKPANLTRKLKAKQDEATGQYVPNGTAAKGGLNKSILDAGWGMFVGMCAYKAVWAELDRDANAALNILRLGQQLA